MPNTNTYSILAATIAAVVFTMLIGLRFDARWAGGEGYKHQNTFMAVDTRAPDGEPLNTGPNSYERGAVLETGANMKEFISRGFAYPCSIWLDQNTQVVIQNAQQRETEFSLITGRIIVDCQATVTSREARIDFFGKATAVNYSWLHTFDGVLLDGAGTYAHGDQTGNLTVNTAISMDTIDNTKPVTTTGFDPEASAAAAFYEWALTDE